MNKTESLSQLRSRVEDLTRSVAAINARLASLAPEGGEVAGLRRKVLEHDLKIAKLEAGSLAELLAAKPYSE